MNTCILYRGKTSCTVSTRGTGTSRRGSHPSSERRCLLRSPATYLSRCEPAFCHWLLQNAKIANVRVLQPAKKELGYTVLWSLFIYSNAPHKGTSIDNLLACHSRLGEGSNGADNELVMWNARQNFALYCHCYRRRSCTPATACATSRTACMCSCVSAPSATCSSRQSSPSLCPIWELPTTFRASTR